jgi:subtilisin family serine protease
MKKKAFLLLVTSLLISLSLSNVFAAPNNNSSNKPSAKPSAKPVAPKPVGPNSAGPNSVSTPSPESTQATKTDDSNKNQGAINKQAKVSANIKLNPSSNLPTKINIGAQKVKQLSTKASVACQGKTPAEKSKIASDPCSDFIVVFVPGFAKAKSQELLSASNAQVKREFSSIFNGALVNGPLSKMQALANNPNVLVVEDDLEINIAGLQTPAPWGLDRIDQAALPLSNSYDDLNNSGENTYSFVVDTGIDASNSEFSGRIASGFTAINDGLGSKDCNGHGTHVAGIIGAKTYGVAKSTNLIPVRVLDCNGSGSYSSVISGLDWIAANYSTGSSAVVNMSLGGSASSTIDGAVSTLISRGLNVVVAAGNSNADACNFSPARVKEAITVGATDRNDSRASYSNFGSCLDLFAPGSSITSTWLGSSGVNTISGTSMAAPKIAGIVARFISNNSGLTPQQVSNSIISSSTKDVVLNAGNGSFNRLSFAYITPNLVVESPTSSTPTFKKVVPRGKKR